MYKSDDWGPPDGERCDSVCKAQSAIIANFLTFYAYSIHVRVCVRKRGEVPYVETECMTQLAAVCIPYYITPEEPPI